MFRKIILKIVFFTYHVKKLPENLDSFNHLAKSFHELVGNSFYNWFNFSTKHPNQISTIPCHLKQLLDQKSHSNFHSYLLDRLLPISFNWLLMKKSGPYHSYAFNRKFLSNTL